MSYNSKYTGEEVENILDNAIEVDITDGVEPEEAEIWIDLSEEPEGGGGSTTLVFNNVEASNWVDDTEYADYPYRCDIACEGATANDYADVVFDVEQATSGEYSPVCETGEGIVSIWSSTNEAITVLTIVITKV